MIDINDDDDGFSPAPHKNFPKCTTQKYEATDLPASLRCPPPLFEGNVTRFPPTEQATFVFNHPQTTAASSTRVDTR